MYYYESSRNFGSKIVLMMYLFLIKIFFLEVMIHINPIVFDGVFYFKIIYNNILYFNISSLILQ